MNIKKRMYDVENGIFFVSDVNGGRPPYPVTDERVQWTSSCVNVHCMHEIDGTVTFTLAPFEDIAVPYEIVFDGTVETPSRELMISSVETIPLLKTEVPESVTRIRIWANHPKWPDKVVVGWG